MSWPDPCWRPGHGILVLLLFLLVGVIAASCGGNGESDGPTEDSVVGSSDVDCTVPDDWVQLAAIPDLYKNVEPELAPWETAYQAPWGVVVITQTLDGSGNRDPDTCVVGHLHLGSCLVFPAIPENLQPGPGDFWACSEGLQAVGQELSKPVQNTTGLRSGPVPSGG